MNSLTEERQREFTVSWEWEQKAGGKDIQGVWDEHVHTDIFKMDNQQGPT